jgi:hypothetical protein
MFSGLDINQAARKLIEAVKEHEEGKVPQVKFQPGMDWRLL